VDFTREPIIETVITPKEGCKLVVRSSKSPGQEEYFVDALEVVSFGNALFFRSTERPKSFLVPATDYEILEAREARMVLKNVGMDRAIKIGGGRETKASKEAEKVAPVSQEETQDEEVAASAEVAQEGRFDKKRDRRRQSRKKRGRDEPKEEISSGELAQESSEEVLAISSSEEKVELPAPKGDTASFISSILPPPTTLISDSIARYKDNALYKGAFYNREEESSDEEPASERNIGEGPAQAEGSSIHVEGFEGIFDVPEAHEENSRHNHVRTSFEEDDSERGFEPEHFHEPIQEESKEHEFSSEPKPHENNSD
jgi:hypothetical protein